MSRQPDWSDKKYTSGDISKLEVQATALPVGQTGQVLKFTATAGYVQQQAAIMAETQERLKTREDMFELCVKYELERRQTISEDLKLVFDPADERKKIIADRESIVSRLAQNVDFIRQIGQSTSTDAMLELLNERFVYIEDFYGFPRVVEFDIGHDEGDEKKEDVQLRMIARNDDDFKKILRIIPVLNGSGKKISTLGEMWLNWENKRQIRGTFYDPKQAKSTVINGKLNLWTGFATKERKGSWKHTRKHIWKVIANRDRTKFKYIIRWMAWCVHNPHKQAEAGIILQGNHGGGKSFLFVQMKKIFGIHGWYIGGKRRLVDKNNSRLEYTSFLGADEISVADDKEAYELVKYMLTSDTINTQDKWQKSDDVPNRLHIGITTNSDKVIPATKDERRFLFCRVSDEYARSSMDEAKRIEYFNKLWGEMNNGGREAMLYDLMRVKLGNWHPRAIPDTQEKQEQVELNLNVYQERLIDIAISGKLPYEKDRSKTDKEGHYWVKSDNVQRIVFGSNTFDKFELGTKRQELAIELRRCDIEKKVIKVVFWKFKSLKEYREKLTRVFGVSDWGEKWEDENWEWFDGNSGGVPY